jgi:hypothetical protein
MTASHHRWAAAARAPRPQALLPDAVVEVDAERRLQRLGLRGWVDGELELDRVGALGQDIGDRGGERVQRGGHLARLPVALVVDRVELQRVGEGPRLVRARGLLGPALDAPVDEP